jgi:hypothetical protein
MRIHNDNSAPTHPEANEWLTEFVIDLKKMMLEQAYQPFTMERLNKWSEHCRGIESCVDFESSFTKRLHDPLISEHASAIMYFNGIVIDLKLMVAGEEYEPITEERIKEAGTHYLEITRCRKARRMFY